MRLFLGIIVALCATLCCQGLYFKVEEGQERCLLEEVPEDTLIVGRYHSPDQLPFPRRVQTGGETATDKEFQAIGIKIIVTDPEEHRLVETTTEAEGRFAFTSAVPGLHKICMSLNISQWFGHKTLRLDLDLTVGEHPVEVEAIAEREHLSGLDVKMERLMDKVKAIRSDIYYFKGREEAFRNTSESTNRRAMVSSILQMAAMVGLSLVQIRYLRNFFVSRKML